MGEIFIPPMQSTVEERKEKLVDKLSTQYSLNQISMEEYERLIKYSQNIETDKELIILEKLIEGHSNVETNDDYVETTEPDWNSDNFSLSNFTLLSSRKTTGAITSGNFTTILGEHRIIINEEDLLKEKTTLNLQVLLGNITIQIPDNVNIICRVIPILGEVSIPEKVKRRDYRKSIIITGNVLLGEVKVKIQKY